MELLFDNKRSYSISIPRSYSPSSLISTGFSEPENGVKDEQPTDLRFLIHYLLHCMLVDKARPDLFSQGDTV